MKMDIDQLQAQLSAEFGGPALAAWPTKPGQRLRPHKGGDGGAKQAQEQEAKRQARIDAATQSINNIFAGSGRDAMYDDQKQAVYDINKQEIDKQYSDAERANRFGLARSGLLGGSAAIDSNAELTDNMDKGLMKAVGLGDAAASDLKNQDEQARQSLISLAQSGIDTGTAQTMALRQLNANAQAAQGAAQGATIGNLFSNMSKAYLTRQLLNGSNTGANTGSQWYGVSAPQQTYAGSTS